MAVDAPAQGWRIGAGMVTLKQLRHFIVLAEELHFGRAADRLAITQPPLSSSIKLLEMQLGVVLFQRDNRNVALTQAGKGFLREARHALLQAQRACDVAQSLAQGLSGYIDVGITGSMLFRGVPDIVRRFMQNYPDVHIGLSEQSTTEQIDALQSGRLDVGFINYGVPPSHLTGVRLPVEPFVCCVPDTHPLAQRASVPLRALSGESFVMFVRELSPYNYDNVISACAKAGFHPSMRYAARQWLTVSALVASGLGVALVPASIARSGIQGARFLPLEDIHTSSYAWCLRRKDNQDPATQAFIDIVRQSLPDAVAAAGG